MGRKPLLICAVVVVLGFVAVNLALLEKSARKRADFDRFLRGVGRVTSLEFTRQNTSIRVEQREVLRNFEDAFNHPSQSSTLGSSYKVKITFSSGEFLYTDINIWDDKKGFTMADYFNTAAGDPRYVVVSFPETMDPQTKELLEELAWTQGDPPLKKTRNSYKSDH